MKNYEMWCSKFENSGNVKNFRSTILGDQIIANPVQIAKAYF